MARYRNRSYRSSRNMGLERALQHIKEGEELSNELGGTDRDVKHYLFTLPPDKLKRVLDLYESKYDRVKREYAEETMPDWKSGKRKMSGMVATRLYGLLPPLMPLETKYELTKTLWQKYGPHSHKILLIGSDAQDTQIISAVDAYLQETILSYTIPEQLGNRFDWLSGGDVKIHQQLLNHLLDIEKKQAVELTQVQLPTILKHMRSEGEFTHRLSQNIELGNHKFELLFDNTAEGVKLMNPNDYYRSIPSSSGGDFTWIWWIIGIIIILIVANN